MHAIFNWGWNFPADGLYPVFVVILPRNVLMSGFELCSCVCVAIGVPTSEVIALYKLC